jgi:hypothetical protein
MKPDAFTDDRLVLERCTLAHSARCRHPLARGSGSRLPARTGAP